jgi:hypothetical protein
VTLSGHLEAGWITFSAIEEDGSTVVQVSSLARTGDPMYEAGFVLFGHAEQEKFWRTTLEALARHFDVLAQVQVCNACVDPHRNWDRAKNLWHNAAARTAVSAVGSIVSRLLRPGKHRAP